jgi:hypothetical protein
MPFLRQRNLKPFEAGWVFGNFSPLAAHQAMNIMA